MAYKVRRMTCDSYAVFLMEQHLPVISYELLSMVFPCLSIFSKCFSIFSMCSLCFPHVFPMFSYIVSTFFPRFFHRDPVPKAVCLRGLCASADAAMLDRLALATGTDAYDWLAGCWGEISTDTSLCI